MNFLKRYQLIIVMSIMSVLLFSVAIFTDGTCDSGDSVTHYLYARYAFAHPSNFIDHWAKPVFVLLASPFAQFGFVGIKIFNVLISLFTAFFVFRIATKLEMKNAILAPVFLFAFPLYFISIFSGLTEPLFGLILVLAIWLILTNKLTAGMILISFLPFCRSEGLIILIIAAFYLMIKGKSKKIFLLLVGHVFYSLVGASHYNDLFWVFSKIPYKGEVLYGHGDWFRFFEQSPAIFGIPLLFIFIIGLISLMKKKNSVNQTNFRSEKLILIYGSFLTIFFAHVIFWRFGLFSSYGLKRVIVAVLPLAALISLSGINWIMDGIGAFNKRAARITISLTLVYVLGFPFMSNPYAIHLDKDFTLMNDQKAIQETAMWIKENHPDKKIYSEHYYVAMALDIDPFDPNKFERWNRIREGREDNALVIWDSWYAAQIGIKLEDVEMESKELKLVVKEGAKIAVLQKL